MPPTEEKREIQLIKEERAREIAWSIVCSETNCLDEACQERQKYAKEQLLSFAAEQTEYWQSKYKSCRSAFLHMSVEHRKDQKNLVKEKQRTEELKKAAEIEFQRAEGKEEMKRWFQEQLIAKDLDLETLERQREELMEALSRILDPVLGGYALGQDPFSNGEKALTKIRGEMGK